MTPGKGRGIVRTFDEGFRSLVVTVHRQYPARRFLPFLCIAKRVTGNGVYSNVWCEYIPKHLAKSFTSLEFMVKWGATDTMEGGMGL